MDGLDVKWERGEGAKTSKLSHYINVGAFYWLGDDRTLMGKKIKILILEVIHLKCLLDIQVDLLNLIDKSQAWENLVFSDLWSLGIKFNLQGKETNGKETPNEDIYATAIQSMEVYIQDIPRLRKPYKNHVILQLEKLRPGNGKDI